MIIRIDQMDRMPVYQQIRNQIVAAIGRGELCPTDRLPSVRSLASDLGINIHTVNKAYAVLRDEGYLFMLGRSGATATPERIAINSEELAEKLQQLALEHRAQGGTKESFLEIAHTQAKYAFV